jgi:hypothetical protein
MVGSWFSVQRRAKSKIDFGSKGPLSLEIYQASTTIGALASRPLMVQVARLFSPQMANYLLLLSARAIIMKLYKYGI